MRSNDKTKTIFFDESGNTGVNLLDPVQKFFSVASTDLLQDEAFEVLKNCFPERIGKDIKFKDLIGNWRNHDGLLKFAHAVGDDPDRYFCYLMNKRFALLCRLVDWIVEPFFHSRGFDWYRDDYGFSYVNTFDLAFQFEGLESTQTEIISLFEEFAKSPNQAKLMHMQSRFSALAQNAPKNIRRFLEHLSAGADEFESHYVVSDFKDSNDLHVTSVVSSIAWWGASNDCDFNIVHDQSNHFFDRQSLWELVSSVTASEALIVVGDKSMRFPLRVQSTVPGDSKALYSLQICDLIAGFFTKSKASKLDHAQRGIIDKMLDAGLSRIGFDTVDRGSKFASGLPPHADGPDAIDQVARSIYNKS